MPPAAYLVQLRGRPRLRVHKAEADLDEKVGWVVPVGKRVAERRKVVHRVLPRGAAVCELALSEEQQLVEHLEGAQARLVDGGDHHHARVGQRAQQPRHRRGPGQPPTSRLRPRAAMPHNKGQ